MCHGHKAKQAEFRRLKAERKACIEREEEERKQRTHFMSLQKHQYISYNDILKLFVDYVPQNARGLHLNPIDGGYELVWLEYSD